MKAVIYARYSSRNQTELSIEGQLRECRAFAKREGYSIIGEYIDRAKTAKSDVEKRLDFQKMAKDSSKRQFEIVIVYQLDRFARNRFDSANYKYRLKKNGVRVVSARENISDDASGILMESVLEGMAEYYSAELSQKIKRGIETSIAQGKFIGSIAPLGFRITEDKRYEIDPATAPIVKKVFELYSGGHSLKEAGVAITEEFGLKVGNPYNFIGKILENRQYIGTYTRGGHVVENAIPRIISDELFERVQLIRNKKKKTKAAGRAYEEYILTTKLYCGLCGEMMVGTGGTSKTGKVHHYYGCKSKIKKKGCTKKNVHKNMIEDFMIARAREQLTDENISLIAHAVSEISRKENNNHVISELKRKIKDAEKAIENLLQAIESGEHISLLSERITKKQDEKTSLEKMLASEKLSKTELDENEIKFFLHNLKKGNVDSLEYRRALVAIFVNAIYLYDDKARIVFNASDRPVEIDCELKEEIEGVEDGDEGGGRCSYIVATAPLPYSISEPRDTFSSMGCLVSNSTETTLLANPGRVVFYLPSKNFQPIYPRHSSSLTSLGLSSSETAGITLTPYSFSG